MKAKVRVNRYYTIGEIDKRIYGSFLEHLGRAVYGGIYEPGHEKADSMGFRDDVAELVKKLRVPIVRYPGGNFVSGYDWEDGIGDRAERPRKIDCAWNSVETNEVGIDEFQAWAKKADTEVMMAVNLGTKGPQEALNCLEYCNLESDSHYANLRRKNGFEKPFGIKTWCLGNEMDGWSWQIGHKTAEEYGRVATETAKLMKWADPSIELVLCGSSSDTMPTFAEWDLTVLEHAYDYVDYISLHRYFNSDSPLTPERMGDSILLDRYIKAMVNICDTIKARKHSGKTIQLSVDEWNVAKPSEWDSDKEKSRWAVAPVIGETSYSLGDALVVGCLLMTLQNNCDRVKMACLAQLVNFFAPIMAEKNGPTWVQTIFYPFLYASTCGRGTALKALVQGDSYSTESLGEVPYLETSVIHDSESKTLTVFAVNRSLTDELTTDFTFEDFGDCTPVRHVVLYSDDVEAVNSPGRELVKPEELPVSGSASPRQQVAFRKHSWNMLQYRYDSDGEFVYDMNTIHSL